MDEHSQGQPGGLIRGYRRAAGLTQQQLAEAAGVSVGVVRDAEQGRTGRLHSVSARRLAGALGLDRRRAGELIRAARGEAGAVATGVPGRAGRLRIGVLGPLAAWQGGELIALGPPMQRAVLGLLALHPGAGLSRPAIIDALWADDPPAAAVSMIQSYVSRLRGLLGPRAALAAAGTGYRLEPGGCEVDLVSFAALAHRGQDAAAAGELAAACGAYASALALWRGEPVADTDVLRDHPAVILLTRQRADAITGYAQAASAAGWHDRALPQLQELAGREPLNERAHARLMIALAGTGQQAAALEVYQQLARRLDDQLGMRPGTELADAHARVLRQDIPALRAAPATAATGRTAAQPAGQSSGDAGPTVPRQLPATVADFTGRAAELAALTAMLNQAGAGTPGTVVISAIGGTAGVGKTALALHWAHQAVGRFGDGQLYVNLRGFDPSGTPVAPEAVIRGFLDALGVPPGRIPPAPEAQAGLYRSLLADKRMLVVLDNARDEQQVRPLLPACPGSLVLVTSRRQLSGLGAADGARLISLDVLSHAEAVRMLTARLGAAEPAAVGQIASLCAHLPLALAVAAARAAARPGFPLAALAAELADSADRLDALDSGDPATSVRAVFSWSTRQLSGEAGRMFALLGIHPGPDISVPAAASLTAIAEADARRLLREVARAHLITEHLPGRYAFHDLLRAYAAEQAHTGNEPERDAAVGRLLDHYLHTAARAALLLNPAKEPVALAPPRPGAAPGQPADRRKALAWFEAEHQVLLAAVALAAASGFDTHAWQLPWAMTSFLQPRGHWQERAATQHTALAAATRLGDTAAQALSGRLLAMACTELGDHDQARGHFASSLALYQRLGDRLGEAKIQHSLCFAAERQGRYADALGHAEQALRLFKAIGDQASEAGALNSVGWYHSLFGDYQQARVFCRQALTLCTEIGHRWLEGHVWDRLGYAEHHLGNLAEATACYQRALSLHREVGDRLDEAETLTHIGDTRQATGELARAREAWQQALTILEDIHHPNVGQVRAKLASTNDHAFRNPPA